MNWLQKNIDVFLPQYLSDTTKNSLRESLRQFPKNIDGRMYDGKNIDDCFIIKQGDGIEGLDFYEASSQTKYKCPCLVVSNSCDISPSNERFSSINVCCAPIYKLDKFAESLKSKFNHRQVENFLASIRKQEVSHCFYLPSGSALKYEGIVFFDKIMSYTNSEEFYEKLKQNHFFSLSQYGFYLFLFKLSYHFTRMGEGIDRDTI